MRLNFLTMPLPFFSTIMASVVGLEAVDKKSTTVGGDMPDFLKMSRNTFRP